MLPGWELQESARALTVQLNPDFAAFEVLSRDRRASGQAVRNLPILIETRRVGFGSRWLLDGLRL